jgi:acetate kinase
MLNKHSGLLGISGITNDVRELYEQMEKGEARAKLAMDIMAYRLRKYLGAYMAALNGADAIVFTAGIGENNAWIREKVLENMEFMGIRLDKKKNKAASGEAEITLPDSPTRAFVIPTNEELVIARDTARIVRKRK